MLAWTRFLKTGPLWVACFALCAGCFSPDSPEIVAHPEPARHVVVILIDTLRADHLPTYGYPRDTAPFLTKLAEESTVFTQAISTSSYTPEAVNSLFTGTFPSATPTGAGWYARPGESGLSLAPRFRELGYRTALFSASPVIKQPAFFRGFEYSKCYTEFGLSGQSGLLVTEALQWLQSHKEEDTLLYLHFLDPHAPFEPPATYRERFEPAPPDNPLDWLTQVRPNLPTLLQEGFGPGEHRFDDLVARYDAEIRLVDDSIAALFTGMEAMDMTEDTLVVVTADHGEEFLDHGFIEHAWRLYPETLHIPLFFWRPGVLPPARNDTHVSIVDIFPSLLALQHMPPPPDTLNGRALFAQDTEGHWSAAPPARPLISELLIQSRSMVRTVLDPPWFYVAAPKWLTPEACSAISESQRTIREALLSGEQPEIDPWAPPVHEELYRLDTDPKALEDLHATEDVALERMRGLLEAYRKTCPPQLSDRAKQPPKDGNGLTPEERQELESLGYSGVPDAAPTTPEDDPESGASRQELESLGYL